MQRNHRKTQGKKEAVSLSCSLVLREATIDEIHRFMEGRPNRIQIECCRECPARCSYCYSSRTVDSIPLRPDEIKRVITEASNLGVRHVEWMGGDPLQRSDWPDLLTFARRKGMINHVWTTGLFLRNVCTSKKLIELTRDGTVTFRVDSLDEKVLERIRDEPDPRYVGKAMSGLFRLLEAGKPRDEVFNAVMVTREHSSSDVLNTIRRLKTVHGINTRIMSLKPVHQRARDLTPEPSLFKEMMEVELDHPPILRECSMRYCATTFFIDVEGNLSRCYAMREKLGSVREARLSDLIEMHREKLFFLEMREPRTPNRCHECSRIRNCWGCRANAFYYSGDAFSPDPFCSFQMGEV